MTTDQSLAARAAWLSFIGGCTQNEIARRLGVSPTKAHRLISQAQKAGLVRVFVDGVPDECVELEQFISSHFQLNSCAVAPFMEEAADGDTQFQFAGIGAAAARLIHELLGGTDPLLIGVGKGRSLNAMVRSLPKIERPDLKFVAVSGSLTRKLSANPLDVVHALVERTGGEGYFLPVPYIAHSAQERDLLQSQKSVQDMLRLGREAEAYIIGIGAIGDKPQINAHIREVGMVSTEEWADLISKGAVCDIMGSFIDINGQPVDSYVNDLSLGLGPEDIRGKKVIAIIGGTGKGEAVLAALRTGIITDLVLCEDAAITIRDLLTKGAA